MDRPVLLTGGLGHVGSAILSGIGDEYDWRLFDRRPPEEPLPHDVVVGDITDADDVQDACAGIGAVIHLAGDPRPEAAWPSVLENNIHGTYSVLRAAVDAGVDRFVFASSNHAVGHYETAAAPALYEPDRGPLLDGTEFPRPGNLYGVSKAAGEVLCRYFHDEYDLTAACVRIGNLTKGHPPEDYARGQAMWLSHRDCAHLFDRCLRAEFGYEIVYGISANDGAFYSLERAREVLGYDPQDNAGEHVER